MAKKKEIQEFVATGRRKTSVSSVRLRKGKGNININGRQLDDYFPVEIQRKAIFAPLKLTDTFGKFDMIIRVKGGGIEGQVTATRLGIARALEKDDESRRQKLKAAGFLTRDPRKKERKKYGQKGARASFQFSKR